jgi:hypothetical protein
MSADFYNDLSELRCIPRGGVKREPHPKKELPWQGVHRGKTWSDMPGAHEDERKLSFMLFRRGKLDQNLDGSWTRWKSVRSKASLEEEAARQARTREVWPRLQQWISAGWSAERLGTVVAEMGIISRVPFLTQLSKPNIAWTLKMLTAADAFLAAHEVPTVLEKAPSWWKHMPGADEETKKRNFALWKEGKMQLMIDERSPQQQRGHLTRRFVDEEPGAQDLIADVMEIARTRGRTVHEIAREISVSGGISHSHAYGIFKGRYKLTVVMAKPIREWLAKQREAGSQALASAATEGGGAR